VGAAQHPPDTTWQKACRVLLSSRGKSSWGGRATRLGVARPPTSYGRRARAAPTEAPVLAGERPDSDGDAMGHGRQANPSHAGASTPGSRLQGARAPGDAGVVRLPPANASMPQDTIATPGALPPLMGSRVPTAYPETASGWAKPLPRRWRE